MSLSENTWPCVRRRVVLMYSGRTRWGLVVNVTTQPRVTPGKRTPDIHWTGGWVGLRAGLDTEARGNVLLPLSVTNLDRPVVQSVARHYTKLHRLLNILNTISVIFLLISFRLIFWEWRPMFPLTLRVKAYICEYEHVALKTHKANAVPVHATEALGRRGDMAPTHSWPRY
jgi:hypothetical protein